MWEGMAQHVKAWSQCVNPSQQASHKNEYRAIKPQPLYIRCENSNVDTRILFNCKVFVSFCLVEKLFAISTRQMQVKMLLNGSNFIRNWNIIYCITYLQIIEEIKHLIYLKS